MQTGNWPFVGRQAEFSLILEDLSAGRGVVVAGVAGVGKSRLAREVAARLRSDGVAVTHVVGTRAAATVPLGAFGHLLDPSELTSAAPGLEPLSLARASVLGMAPGEQLVLLVDDLHLLDDASAALVHSLAMTGEATILGTLREGAGEADAITALWKDDLCSRLDLMPLSRDESSQLLSEVLGGEVEGVTRHELGRRSGGNLLFLRELVRGGVASGSLRCESSLWSWHGPIDSPVHLRELVAEGLESRSPDETEILHIVSLGEPLAWSVLAGLTDERAAEQLVADGFLDSEDLEGVLVARLHHPLLGEVLRSSLSSPRRRRLLRTLAEHMSDVSAGSEADALRIATWRLEAGERLDAGEAVTAARACMLLDAGLTERLARAALDAGGGPDARIVLAQHLMFTHRPEEADSLLDDPSLRDLTLDERLAVDLMRANNLTFGLGQPDDAVDLLEALRRKTTSHELADMVESHLLPSLLFAGRVAEATERAKAMAGADKPPSVRLRAAITLVPALAVAGKPQSALAVAGEALRLAALATDELPFALGQIGAGMILAQQWAGDLDAADAIARVGYDASVDRGSTLLRGVAALRLGQTEMLRGRMVTAVSRVRESVMALHEADAGFLASAMDHLDLLCASTGSDPSAAPPRSRRDRLPAELPLYLPDCLRLRAGTSLARGNLREASELLADSLRSAMHAGQVTQALFAAYELAVLGDHHASEVKATRPGIEGPLLSALLDAIEALEGKDAECLDAVSEAFACCGCNLFAAQTASAAARLYAEAGLRVKTAAARDRAAALAEMCEGVRVAVPHAENGVAHLTPREREVAALAARGESDASIADLLGLSVRTVQTHLHHVYNKLGVNSRRDLPGAPT